MRLTLTAILGALSCTPVVAISDFGLAQLKQRMPQNAPECVRRFVDGPREHAKVSWLSCRTADAFLQVYRSTSVNVTIKLKKPLEDITRPI